MFLFTEILKRKRSGTISFPICAAMTLSVCLHLDLAPQSLPALTVPLTLIATGSPANSRNWHARSILWGMTGAQGTSCASQGRAILALYRSAAQPVMRDLGTGLPRAAVKPGLALIATEDSYCGGETLARRSAERAQAKVAVLKGAGHWWMCQQPKQGADAINAFVANLN